MCLEVTLTLSKLAKSGVSAERLYAESGLTVLKGKNNLGTCLHFSLSGQCSCDLLQTGAKHVGAWELDHDARTRLAGAVALYGKDAKSFTYQARWLGEDTAAPQRMKLQALLEAIRSNGVPKNTPILVGSHP